MVLGYRDPTIFRIAVLGLWAFTNLELAYALLRVDERLRTYATASLINVGLTIAASVVLVVVLGQGARGLLLGNYGASTVVLLGLWWTMRDRLLPRRHPRCRGATAVLLRFGLPTVPAEASVYALSIVDRYYIFHHRVARGWPACTRSRSSSPARWPSSCARSSTRGRRSPTRSAMMPRLPDCMDW